MLPEAQAHRSHHAESAAPHGRGPFDPGGEQRGLVASPVAPRHPGHVRRQPLGLEREGPVGPEQHVDAVRQQVDEAVEGQRRHQVGRVRDPPQASEGLELRPQAAYDVPFASYLHHCPATIYKVHACRCILLTSVRGSQPAFHFALRGSRAPR